jgi:hypothetical protein
MPLIRGIHSGAKAILAYFHWSCKGNIPFAADFNWNSKKAQSMANIDAEQGSFMVRLGNLARQKGISANLQPPTEQKFCILRYKSLLTFFNSG